MQNITEAQLQRIIQEFIPDPIQSVESYLGGHIHDTYLVTSYRDNKSRYLLQKMNTHVFRDPQRLMENIQAVSAHIRNKAGFYGKPADRVTLRIVPTQDSKLYFTDEQSGAWRLFDYIENTFSVELPQNLDQVRDAASVTGEFLKMLADFPVDSLYIPLVDFHNTPKRYRDFLAAVENGIPERINNAKAEISFLHKRADKMGLVQAGLNNGSIPWRVTHNDTKLENILIDGSSGRCLCLIDLDTVMPGSSLFDFGDAIRAMANPAGENEKDLSKVNFQMPVFEAYTDGFLSATRDTLTPREIELIPHSAWLITLEIGMRFLSDYLVGDTYFKIDYPENNLVRARTQLKLVSDMENMEAEMQAITHKFSVVPSNNS